MISLKDIQRGNFYISLGRLVGERIADIEGYLSNEFGSVTFKVSKVILDSGKVIGVEGEHDFPYLTNIPVDTETLDRLYKEERGDDKEG